MKKKSRRTRGRPAKSEHGEGSRNEIIKAYLKLIYEIGPDQITQEKIANKAGVTLGTVRYYFTDTQPELYMAALDFHLEQVFRLMDRRLSEDRLKLKSQFNPLQCYIDTIFEWVSNPVDASFELYFYFLCTTQNRVATSSKDLFQLARVRIGSFLRECVGWGRVRAEGWTEAQFEAVCHKIHNVLVGSCIVAITEGTSESLAANRKLCSEMIFKDLLKS